MDNSGIIGPIATMNIPDSSAGSGQNVYAFTDITTIADGTYSCISRARRHNQWWVLKSMKGDYALQPFFQQMLQKEYDLLIRMHHSGIDRPISIEHVEGLGPCLVMECIEGVTLSEFQTDLGGRRRIAFQIVETMAYVHSCQVVHRDLKPANIMVTHNGQYVKIIDFGLADADNYAVLKQPAGTPRYISPEQIESNDPDVRNDVYSLGVIIDDLQLGPAFRHIIRRCTGPIERRYMGAGELLRAMRRAERLPALVTVVASILLIALLTSAPALFFPHSSGSSERTDASAVLADSSTKLISSTKPEQATAPDETGPQTSHTAVVPQEKALPRVTETAPPAAEISHRDAAYEAATRRVDKYMVDHHYAQLLRTILSEPAPSQPWTRDPRCKELERQEAELLQGLWAEVEQIRKDARSQMSESEAELLYTSVVNYAMSNYSQKIGKALREYFNRKPSLGS